MGFTFYRDFMQDLFSSDFEGRSNANLELPDQ